jgi:hypothetical protein
VALQYISNQEDLKHILFHDYQIIKTMLTPQSNKIKLLSTLFSINPNNWCVIGITPAALAVFELHQFEKKSGMGINRSHLTQRHSFYDFLLSNEIQSASEFWELYIQNDKTILATSSENMSKDATFISEYLEVPRDQRNLFQTAGFAWKHKEEEINFLKELAIQQRYSTK